MDDNFKRKLNELFVIAGKQNVEVVVGIKDHDGAIGSFCSKDFISLEGHCSEEVENMYLMLKHYGDLNEFMLAKSRIQKNYETSESLISANPQTAKTQH
jgi:hypothetical protein